MSGMNVNAGTTFSEIYQRLGPGVLSNTGQHLRLEGQRLHTHTQLVPHRSGDAAMTDRKAKYDRATLQVHQAIANEHGPELADRVFGNLQIGGSITLADLRQIKHEIRRERQPVEQAVAVFESIPEPGVRRAGTGGQQPTAAAALAGDIYDAVEAHVRASDARSKVPDKQTIADILNQKLRDFQAQHGQGSLNGLTLRDRAMLLEMIDKLDLRGLATPHSDQHADGETPPGFGFDKALLILAQLSPKPQLADRFDIHSPTSDYAQKKLVLFNRIAADPTIKAALGEPKVSVQDKLACMQIAVRIESEVFGYQPAPLVVSDTIKSIGNYDRGARELHVGRSALDKNLLTEVLNIACHENMHHFQAQFMDEVSASPKTFTEDERFQAQIFDLDLKNYMNSRIDHVAYNNQSIERPAMAIGNDLKTHLKGLATVKT